MRQMARIARWCAHRERRLSGVWAVHARSATDLRGECNVRPQRSVHQHEILARNGSLVLQQHAIMENLLVVVVNLQLRDMDSISRFRLPVVDEPQVVFDILRCRVNSLLP